MPCPPAARHPARPPTSHPAPDPTRVARRCRPQRSRARQRHRWARDRGSSSPSGPCPASDAPVLSRSPRRHRPRARATRLGMDLSRRCGGWRQPKRARNRLPGDGRRYRRSPAPQTRRPRRDAPRVRASLDHPRHAANVVVVPVRGDDQHDGPSRIEIDAPQVVQGRRRVGATTRVHYDPRAGADVQNHALAIPRAEERHLELIIARRVAGNRHRWNARSVSRAQLRASWKSCSVIRGRSRNTIRDTRFFVPEGDRS